jgi:predicted amidophosphoribosyltransferase
MLTQTQWVWLQCHILLDDGGQLCAACGTLGAGAYCATCGTRLVAEDRHCGQCQLPSTGAYCPHCGAELQSLTAEQIELGAYDWVAWAKGLAPFLGGLTPQEQALLERG